MARGKRRWWAAGIAVAGLSGAGWGVARLVAFGPPPALAGLPAVHWPARNQFTRERVELGRLLFFDGRLSSNGKVSCATCHDPARGFADGRKVAEGILKRRGERNTPTIINAAYNREQFWDGRAASLEEQALASISNPQEMTTETTPEQAYAACVSRLTAVPEYRRRFAKAFSSSEITILDVAAAIASFERTVLSGNSPYDRYLAGDRSAMTPSQIRGLETFRFVGCDGCHRGIHFTDGAYIMSGIGMRRKPRDPGRFVVSKFPQDFGAFRTTTLRDVALTAPYMHDGSIATLQEVVEHYDKGVKGTDTELDDRLMAPKQLSKQQRADLVAFMKALSGTGWQTAQRPVLP